MLNPAWRSFYQARSVWRVDRRSCHRPPGAGVKLFHKGSPI